MFKIADGRTSFWQWDVGQQLIVNDGVCCEVHFCNGTTDCALVSAVYEQNGQRVVNVPNVLLQAANTLHVFAYAKGEGEQRTMHSANFLVLARTKPDDYVYTETEVWTAEKAVAEALEEAKASGDFKGDKGDKGDAGVVEFIVVNELPDSDIKNAIYLMQDENGEAGNLFGEYVYINGAWERVGSAGVEINLDDYVKNTDYATHDKAGVVKVNKNGSNGLYLESASGTLVIKGAAKEDIRARGNYLPIIPYWLDYAIKDGLVNNKEEWTEEERKAARDLLGVDGLVGDIETALDGIIAIQNELIGGDEV